jgi:chloride channel protein, CIC family
VPGNPLAHYLNKLPSRTRGVVQVCLYGLAAGLVAVAFHVAIHSLYHATFVNLSHESTTAFLVGSFLTIVCTSLLVGYLLNHFCTDARGSGIPQLKVAFWKDFGYVPWRVVWVKFVAGVLSIGGGCSLGREGPSVQLAGGLGSQLAGVAGEPKQKRRNAAAAGAAAGLAAAFNTPLAAMTFVLEEIVGDLNSRFLGSVLLASVIGAFVVHGILGKQPAFELGSVQDSTWEVYVLIPAVAAVASLVGVWFQNATLKLRARRKGFERVPLWIRPALGGLITWVLGCAVFVYTGHLGVFSLGYENLSAGLTGQLDWRIAGVLLVAKLVATICCYGLGGCGGIFSPTLFFGGACGLFLAGIAGVWMPLNPADHIVLGVVGMSCCLGAVVRAPVTSVLIVFEMTHEFELVPALMLGTLVSQAISRRMLKHNFYEALLEQDGHNLEHLIPPRDLATWHQLPVSAIANFQPVLMHGTSPEELQRVLKAYPYIYFPVVENGRFIGVLSRAKAEAALKSGQPAVLQPAGACLPNESIRRLQRHLIDSPTGIAVVVDKAGGNVIGIVTMHDLLRAEVAMAEGNGG